MFNFDQSGTVGAGVIARAGCTEWALMTGNLSPLITVHPLGPIHREKV